MDVVLAYIFGALGYGMKITGWPRIPMMIALVLGPLLERNFLLSARLFELGRIELTDHPIAIVLMVMIVLVLLYSVFSQHNAKWRRPA